MRVPKRELFIAFIMCVIFLTIIPIFTYLYFVRDLQSKESIMNKNDTGVVLLDRNGEPFFRLYEAHYRTNTPLSEIPLKVRQAVIVAEDKDFYYHPGFSVRAIIAAVVADLRSRDLAYGGSTITQQLVKNSLLDSNKSFLRKYQELILAQEVDRRYSKDEILEMYLNSAYFGDGAFGIAQASQTFFGKEVKDLDLAESALIAGVLPAPSRYSPISGSLEEAKERQKHVLKEMQEGGYIKPDEMKKALDEKLTFAKKQEAMDEVAPHFALYVRQQLVDMFGEEKVSRAGFKVKTTLDVDWQKFAEKTVADNVARLAQNNAHNGAAVVIDPKTGEIKVMVGSKDWYDDKFGKLNVAVTPRQPGSSFKPIIYLAALEQELITPATILKDEPTTFRQDQYSEPYKPLDYDKKFRGRVTVRRSLANSLNIPSVQIMQMLGVENGLEMAKRMGITSLGDVSNYGLSLVLGAAEVSPLELTSAYATLANEGERVEPISILEIEDKRGKRIYKAETKKKRVVEPSFAFLISSILSDASARAEVFGNALNISRPAAVKTGTTESYRDAWTVGYTPQLAIGVWVGNNDNTAMDNIAGSLGAAPIWRALMEQFLKGEEVLKFVPPSGVTRVAICKDSGLRLRESTSSANLEYFAAGTEPTKYCQLATPAPSASPNETPTTTATPVSVTPEPTNNSNQSQTQTIEIHTENGQNLEDKGNKKDKN